MAVLDTCFLIALDKQDPKAVALAKRLSESQEPLVVPAAVWAEYLSGLPAAYRSARARSLAAVAEVAAFDRHLADHLADLQGELMRRGEPIGWHDGQVAATALARRDALVTTDRRLAALENLEVLAW